MRIRTKFTLLISFIFLGAVLIIWYGVRPGYEQAVVEERLTIVTEYQREKVQNAADMIDTWFQVTREIQNNLSENASIQQTQTLFSGYSALLEELHSIRVVEENTGEFIEIRANDTKSTIDIDSLNFHSRHYRNNALFTAYDPEEQKFLVVSNFDLDGDPFRLVLLFDGTPLNEILFSKNLGVNERSVLWLDEETVLSESEVPDFKPPYESVSTLQEVLINEVQTFVLSSPLTPIEGLYTIYLDKADIQLPIRRLFRQSIWIVGISFLILGVAGILFFRQFTEPVNRFIDDLQPFGSYNFKKPITQTSIPELHILSRKMEEIRQKLLHYQKINVEQIISSQEKHQIMMDYSTDLIAVFDGDENFTFHNNRFTELFDDVHEQLPTDLPAFRDLKMITTIRQKGKKEYVLDPLRIQRVSNDIVVLSTEEKKYFFDMHLVEIFTDDNQLMGGQLMMYDLTREREMDRVRNDMINIIVHELKNPLSGIMGGTELLKSGSTGMNSDEIYDLIGKSAREMLTLINRFLQISKLEAANTDHKKELTDLKPIISDIIQTMRTVFEQKDLNINFQVEDAVKPVSVVPDLFADMVRNLLSNAVKYGPVSRDIDVVLQTEGNKVLFSVTDHGYGIAEKDREQIFKKFYRIKEYVSEQGTGLGLPYVLEIIKKHNGDIKVESDEHIGSRFTVQLPYITTLSQQDNA